MFSKLSQIVTSVPGSASASEEERSPANTRREQARLRQRPSPVDYVVLHPASDDESTESTRPRRPPPIPNPSGPPNISWISDPSRLTHAASAPIIGRSASSPLARAAQTPSPSPIQGRTYSTHLQARSTHSLRLDYRRVSPISTANPFVTPPQSLSPIREQRSPELRPVRLTPISPTREVDVTEDFGARNSPAASYHSSSYFISRPLKRSISQSSANTFGSSVSAVAPSIPPVDLRPPFSVPYTARSGPLPTIAASVHRGSEEDGDRDSTASFVTAPTVYTYASSTPSLLTRADKEGEDEEDDIGTVRDRHSGQRNSAVRSSVVSSDPQRGLYHLSLVAQPSTTSFQSSLLRPPSPRHHSSSLRAPSPTPSAQTGTGRSVTEDPSRSSLFIDKRWHDCKDASYSSTHVEIAPPLAKCNSLERRAPRMLFYLGFVLGPWCWLIGGWLLESYGDLRIAAKEKGKQSGDLEGQHTRQEKADKNKDHDGAKLRGKENGKRYLPLWLRSASKSTPKLKVYPIFAPPADSAIFLNLEREAGAFKEGSPRARLHRLSALTNADADTWVRRCRVAAVVSGVLLMAAFLVALVVVCRLR